MADPLRNNPTIWLRMCHNNIWQPPLIAYVRMLPPVMEAVCSRTALPLRVVWRQPVRQYIDWQNRFDDLIFSAASQTGVPASLLKEYFCPRESVLARHEYGSPGGRAGTKTDGGADTVLTWNPSFYEQFCPSVLDQSVCKGKIYPNPEENWQGIGLDELELSLARCACPKR